MDGVSLLQTAIMAGLEVTTDGYRLCIRGPRRAGRLARQLVEHKAEVLAILSNDLRPGPAITPPDLPGDWYERYEERAAILEYDANMVRADAEWYAFGEVIRMIQADKVARQT